MKISHCSISSYQITSYTLHTIQRKCTIYNDIFRILSCWLWEEMAAAASSTCSKRQHGKTYRICFESYIAGYMIYSAWAHRSTHRECERRIYSWMRVTERYFWCPHLIQSKIFAFDQRSKIFTEKRERNIGVNVLFYPCECVCVCEKKSFRGA